MDREYGRQPSGLLRVRRTFFVASVLVGALTVVVAIFGSPSAASGIAVLILAPLLLILAGSHLTVLLTRPDQRDSASEGP